MLGETEDNILSEWNLFLYSFIYLYASDHNTDSI
jgi:hypothetical protein